jgi:hypothetical protein
MTRASRKQLMQENSVYALLPCFLTLFPLDFFLNNRYSYE